MIVNAMLPPIIYLVLRIPVIQNEGGFDGARA